MIGISKLYLSQAEPSDTLRYGRQSKTLPSHLLQFSEDKKPVVVWNCTKRCNLRCQHCYARCLDGQPADNELTTAEAKMMIDDLAAFGVPVLLFSGGEPMMRPDLYELIDYAVSKGMRAVISTNGTCITPEAAVRLKSFGLSYVGISLDGLEKEHNELRCSDNAFRLAMDGIRNCLSAGVKVGIRLTIHKKNAMQIPDIFKLIESENIPRACFYHFVNCGSGSDVSELMLDHAETRRTVDEIITQTRQLNDRGCKAEILTVDNHCDGAYLWMRMCREHNPNADNVMTLLEMNGGNNSGHAIGCVSWDGAVHPDQFWRSRVLGNIRNTPFSQIWSDPDNPFMSAMRHKYPHVTGRCVSCRFLSVCGGNLRVRAESAGLGLWGEDPACYLTDEEIQA